MQAQDDELKMHWNLGIHCPKAQTMFSVETQSRHVFIVTGQDFLSEPLPDKVINVEKDSVETPAWQYHISPCTKCHWSHTPQLGKSQFKRKLCQYDMCTQQFYS